MLSVILTSTVTFTTWILLVTGVHSNSLGVNDSSYLCRCHRSNDGQWAECDGNGFLWDKCQLEIFGLDKLLITNGDKSANDLQLAQKLTITTEVANISRLVFQDVPFELVEKYVASNSMWDRLYDLRYERSTPIDCEPRLSDQFLFHLSRVAPNLNNLTLINAGLCQQYLVGNYSTEAASSFLHIGSLRALHIHGNNGLVNIPRFPKHLRVLNVSRNNIQKLDLRLEDEHQLHDLDVSRNRISSILALHAPNLVFLNASHNLLTTIDTLSLDKLQRLRYLDLSDNLLTTIPAELTAGLPLLNSLIAARNPLDSLYQRFSENSNLQIVDFTGNYIEFVDIELFTRLKELNILKFGGSRLRFISGTLHENLKSLKLLDISNSRFKKLPEDFLHGEHKLEIVDISSNNWTCNCNLEWLRDKIDKIKFQNLNNTFCLSNSIQTTEFDSSIMPVLDYLAKDRNDTTTCLFGSYATNGGIIRAHYGDVSAVIGNSIECIVSNVDYFKMKAFDPKITKNVNVYCDVYGKPYPFTTWYKYDSGEMVYIGTTNATHSVNQRSRSTYRVNADGTLTIFNITRHHIGIYKCEAWNENGNLTLFFRFRLSYTSTWFLVKIYSIACGILTAMGFFAFNMISGAVRRFVTWRLSQVRRKGRVRMLLEAIEKYRVRQMFSLHDMYTSNVNQIRDNYHQQVEALRKSYSIQAERFRDYRAVQMEQVASHLDALRENYYSQLGRLREYGSRRMDSVWESYQRQVTRLRDYSFQQRIRLMRQYKLKQRYLNRVLENLKHGSPQDLDPKSHRPVAPTFIELHTIDSHLDIDDLPTTSSRQKTVCDAIETASLPDATLRGNGEEIMKKIRYRRRNNSDSLLLQDRACRGRNEQDNDDEPDRKYLDSLSLSSDSYHSVTSLDFVFNDKMTTIASIEPSSPKIM